MGYLRVAHDKRQGDHYCPKSSTLHCPVTNRACQPNRQRRLPPCILGWGWEEHLERQKTGHAARPGSLFSVPAAQTPSFTAASRRHRASPCWPVMSLTCSEVPQAFPTTLSPHHVKSSKVSMTKTQPSLLPLPCLRYPSASPSAVSPLTSLDNTLPPLTCSHAL